MRKVRPVPTSTRSGNRTFLIVWRGQTASLIGSGISAVAISSSTLFQREVSWSSRGVFSARAVLTQGFQPAALLTVGS